MYRENTKEIAIGNVKIGGTHPVTIQSMTNTKTENVKETVDQILRLEAAGCEIIRCAVPTMEAAEALKEIKKQITSYDLFKQWEIHDLNKTQKNQKYVGFQLIAPSSFTKEITTLKKKKNQYDLTISIDPSLLDISELNHYKSTLKLLDSSDALCQMKVIMPGTITYSNYGKYLNNTLTINLFDVFINQVDLSFHVISKKNHQQLYLYFITLFLLGCLIIYLIFFKIRQKKS